MEELTSDKDSFRQALLVELLKSSYEETISHQKQKIISLEHQVAYL